MYAKYSVVYELIFSLSYNYSYNSYPLPQQKAPVALTEKPKDVTVTEGESATFVCCVSCMPPSPDLPPPTPVITWYFMGRPVAGGVTGDDGGEVYSVENDAEEGRYVLCVPEAFPEDAGVYTVRAHIPGGGVGAMAEASAILTVKGT